jgi:hypothetical protein
MDSVVKTRSNLRSQSASAVTATTSSEWRFVWAVIGFVLVICTIPVIYAYATAPSDMRYMGILVNVPDHAQYFQWMREFTTAWLSPNKLTPEPNAPLFFNLLWVVLARVGTLLGMPFETSYQVMYQVLRVVATVAFLLLVYRMCAWFLPDVPRRRTAFLITIFASGFGWVLVLMKYTVTNGVLVNPLDVFVAEGNTFYSALGQPHFIGAALYMFSFDLMLRGQAKKQWRYMVASGLFAQFMGWQHAYDLVIVYAVIGAYVVALTLRDRRIPWFMVGSALLIGIISVWPSLYSFLLTKLDPLWRDVLAQFDNAGVFTPPPYRLPVLLGAPLLLALFAVVADAITGKARGSHQTPNDPQVANNDLFVKVWFLISFALVYIPLDFQIHMLNGWQVPMAILAAVALHNYILPWLSTRLLARGDVFPTRTAQRILMVAMAALILPTNIYLFAQRFIDLRRHDAPYYMRATEMNALKWLEQTVKPDDVVFSSLTVGQYVPMFTGAHAYLGHWAQTLDFFGKEANVKRFFDSATSNADRRAILQLHGVDYVFVGPEERALGGFDPGQSSILSLAHTSGDVNVYVVQNK